jgi:transposase
MRRRPPDQLTRLHEWAVTTAARRGRNKATIAIANKLARIVWAIWRTGEVFREAPAERGAA